MRDFNPHMVDGVGHGNDQVFTGDQGREIYTQGDACCAELAGRAFVPVSCLVGNGLLPYMVDKGLGCGLGEITEYWFGTDPSEPPESDHMVGWFQWSEFAYKSEICVGHDATAAFANMSASYEAHAAAADSTDPDVADLLRYDLLNRKSFGSPAWVVGKIEPPPEPPTPPAPECWLCGILRTLMGWFGCRA